MFGTAESDYLHFSTGVTGAIRELKEIFPEEYATYYSQFAKVQEDAELTQRVHLFNPMDFIDDENGIKAKHFRIRVGGQDADTATTISMALAVKLQNNGYNDTDYAIVWDQPHCDADYPGEVCAWIKKISG